MSRFATGITVVTTKDEGMPYGLTVNAFASVSLDPLLILVSIEKRATTHQHIVASRHFAASILAETQEEISRRFAMHGDTHKFDGIATIESHTGAPVIVGSLAYLAANVVFEYDGSDHTIFIGEVVDAKVLMPDGKPLLYYRSGYRNLKSIE